MNNKFLLPILAVVIVIAGAFWFINNNNTTSNQPQTTENQTATPTQVEQPTNTAVTVTSSGYEPQTITIKAGSQVSWTNTSGGDVTVNSDVHPTHLLFPFLNLGMFTDGASVSVTFEKAGTYTYHNHLDASQKGTVIVE